MQDEVREPDKMDPPSNPDRTLVLVEWKDAQSHSGWRHELDLNDNYQLPWVYTAGYLVQETDQYITISQSMIFYKDVSNQICNIISIPRDWVMKITVLRKGKPYVSKGK